MCSYQFLDLASSTITYSDPDYLGRETSQCTYSDQRLKPDRKRYHDYGIRYLSFSIPKGCHDDSKNRKKVFNPEGVT
ncbi:hypothetical protein KSU1_D0282 [Candidatus Jettenia caeni]|uniref:Uncharacterized protein n=1 Tax=Candidatus Jettenia caeni TaxID=247490 RepID=I3IPE6_9BACT|nr:hypothetical protein KSU1_D0282 [Candidatus Jettenia caeni]